MNKKPKRISRAWSVCLLAIMGIGLWPLSGLWYTAVRAPYLIPDAVAVQTAGAQALAVDKGQLARYGVVSAAEALDADGHISGYVLISEQQGYKSVIRVQSTFTPDGAHLAGVRVLSQNETEYLGDRIAAEGFTMPFAGRTLPVKLWGSAALGSPVDGLSGSTISVSAVVTAVNNAHAFLRAYLAA